MLDYIKINWPRTFQKDAHGSGFMGIDLPFPYSAPCIKGEGHYSFFFYWDTYFTNLGLLRHGYAEMLKNNIRNMLWYIKRCGYMPNHVGIEDRSQPPYLCRMVRDYLDFTGDRAFLPEAAEGLRQEYHFWTTARSTPIGLNRHGQHGTAENSERFYEQVAGRLSLPRDIPSADKQRIGGHHMAEAEARDFTPRFEMRCMDYAEVELNALLYDYEIFLGEQSVTLGWDDAELWHKRAQLRTERIRKYLWSESRGLFLDYDFVNHHHSPVAGIVTYIPLWVGFATKEEASRLRENLPLFERAFGIADTEDSPLCKGYQWAYPAMWPPMVYTTVMGLARYGYREDARRIARKFMDTFCALYEETGQLWEKTDVETGKVSSLEYSAPPMMGFTAGTLVALHEFLEANR